MTASAPATLALLAALAAAGRASRGPEAALAARIRTGDHGAFRRFFDGSHADLLGALRRRGLDAATAEDVAQGAYVWLWEHRDRIEAGKPLRGLLFTVALRRASNARRDAGRTDALPEAEPAASSAGDPAALDDLRRALAEAVADLPERRRETFQLCFEDGLTHAEAAQVMDVSPKTVEHQMGHALKAIRARLAPHLDVQGAASGTESFRLGAGEEKIGGE